jgi:hypothetical protein
MLLKRTVNQNRDQMQTMQLNDNWVIVDGFHENTNDMHNSEQQYPVERATPNWFWTGRRWSSQSARSKLFVSIRDAQSEMRRIRTEPDC